MFILRFLKNEFIVCFQCDQSTRIRIDRWQKLSKHNDFEQWKFNPVASGTSTEIFVCEHPNFMNYSKSFKSEQRKRLRLIIIFFSRFCINFCTVLGEKQILSIHARLVGRKKLIQDVEWVLNEWQICCKQKRLYMYRKSLILILRYQRVYMNVHYTRVPNRREDWASVSSAA